MMESPKSEKKEMIEMLKNFKEISLEKYDLREIKSINELDVLLVKLVKENKILLHGTPNEIPENLEPRLANDTHREAGSRTAVYATDLPERAIFHAVFNKKYLMEKLDSFISGYSNSETPNGKLEFKVTQNVKDLIDGGDTEVFCDGWIYLIENANFEKSEDSETEFQSKDISKPISSLLVSKDLGQEIKERIRVYRPEELKK